MEENIKLYSNREITIATFFGGPLAAGYLMKKNFQVIGDSERADKSFIIGIISTFILFAVLLSLPSSVLDVIPSALIPAIYTAIISLIVNKLQGPFIKAHKENGGLYHSGWKAAGVGSVSMLIILAAIAIVAFLSGDFIIKSDFDIVGYNNEAAKFKENESRALEVYKVLGTADPVYIKGELEKGLVLWKTNKNIVNKLNTFKNLPKEQQVHNQKLLKYCDLRIQLNEIIIKSITDGSGNYVSEVTRIGLEIKNIMSDQ